MKTFKQFYLKENSDVKVEKKQINKSVADSILGIAGSIYSQNPTMQPQDLTRLAADVYMNQELERLKSEMDTFNLYYIDQVADKYPQKEVVGSEINNNKEESKNEK